MKHIYSIKNILLTITLTLLLNACNSNTSHDERSTTSSSNSTTQTGNGNDNNLTTGVEEDNTTTTPTVTLNTLKLTLEKTALNKDENTTVKVMATYSDNTTKEVTDKVEWVTQPAAAIKIRHTRLTALKDGNVTVQAKVGTTLSNKVKLNTTWVINGYRLPPEPDPQVNNATLLGVDSNGNGVRDDVERYIIKTYKDEKIAVEIGFQVARAFNVVIEHPENAEEVDKVLTAAQDCAGYFEDYAEEFGDPILLNTDIVTSKKFKSIMLNTASRIRAYLEYNRNLSGGVFTLTKIKNMKSKCTFDVEQMLKDRK